MKKLRSLLLIIFIGLISVFSLSKELPMTIYEDPIVPCKALYKYDSVNNRIKYFIDNSRFCDKESLDVILPRFEFDSTKFGKLMNQIVDSVQINTCFPSLYLEYSEKGKFIWTCPVGCAANARGLVLSKDSHKPLYIDNSINDSLLEVYHLKEMKDSFLVKLGYILNIDRDGYLAVFLSDEEKEGFLVLFEDISVDSVPNYEIRKKWSWIHDLW